MMTTKNPYQVILQHPIFILSVVILFVHQITQKIFLFKIPLADYYIDDFFAMPFILSLFLLEQHFWKRRLSNLTSFEIVLFTIFFAVFFEELLPILHTNYTKDYWDYLMYGCGSLLFYNTINKSIKI